MVVNLRVCWENILAMTSLIEIKDRKHPELQEKNIRECLANYIKYEISGFKFTADAVPSYHSVVNVKEQGIEQQGGLWERIWCGGFFSSVLQINRYFSKYIH